MNLQSHLQELQNLNPSGKDEICPQNFEIFEVVTILRLNLSVNPLCPRCHVNFRLIIRGCTSPHLS